MEGDTESGKIEHGQIVGTITHGNDLLQADPLLVSERLEQFRQRVTEMQAEGKSKLDAATWTKLDIRIQQTIAQLRQSVWEARLSALLSGI